MTDLGLAIGQARYENKVFWRNPQAAFFTLVFPIMFLVIFELLFGNDGRAATFFIPSLTTFAVITACFTNLAMTMAVARDQGRLKRVRGTPLPTGAYLSGKIANSVILAALLVVIMLVAGKLIYGADLSGVQWGPFVISLVLGAICFCSLGMAIFCFIPNEDAAPAVVNATIFPLLFISDVFMRLTGAPDWLVTVSGWFPVIHLSHALIYSFLTGPSFVFTWWDLVPLLIWTVVGLFVATTRFSWEPRR